MSKLTGTHSEVSEIDFTTLTTVPGTVKVHGAPIQILDLREYSQPQLSRILIILSAGIIEGANDGRGRGRQGTPCTLPTTSVHHLTLMPSCIAKLLPVWTPTKLRRLQIPKLNINISRSYLQPHFYCP